MIHFCNSIYFLSPTMNNIQAIVDQLATENAALRAELEGLRKTANVSIDGVMWPSDMVFARIGLSRAELITVMKEALVASHDPCVERILMDALASAGTIV